MLNMDPSSQWTMFNKCCQNYQNVSNTPILQRYTYESQLLKFHPPLLNRLRNKQPPLEYRILPRSKNLRNDSQSYALRRGMFLHNKSGRKRYSTDFKHAGAVLNSVANKSSLYPNDQNLETSLAEKTIQKCIVDKTTDLLQLIEFKRNYHNHLKAFNNLIKNVTKWMTIAANCVDLESTNFQRCREMKPKPFPDIVCDTISEKCENTSECDINESYQIDANMRTQFTSTSISMIQNVLSKSNQWIGMCDKETQLFRKRKFSDNRKKKRSEINESKTESIAMAVSVANCIPMLCKRLSTPLSCKLVKESLTLEDASLNDLPKALDQRSSKSVHRCSSQSNFILLYDPMLVKKENAREISLEIESEPGNTQNNKTLAGGKYNSGSVDMDDISDKKRKLTHFENNLDKAGSKRNTSLSNIGHLNKYNKANELEGYYSLKTPQRDSKVEETKNVSSNQNGEENDTSNLQFSLLETVMSSSIALYMKSVIEKIKKNSTEAEPLTPINKEGQLKPEERYLDKGNNEEKISKEVNTKNKLETDVVNSSSLNNRTQLENTATETEKSLLDEKSNKNAKKNRRKVLKEQVKTPKSSQKPKPSLPQSILNTDTKKIVNTESENKKKCFFLKKTPLNFSKKSDKKDDLQIISASEKRDDQLIIKRVSSPSVSINSRQASFDLGEKLKDNFSRRRPSTAPASAKSKRQMDKKDDGSNKMKTSNTIATANITKKSDKTTPVIDLGPNLFKKTRATPAKPILKPKFENKQNQSKKATVKGSTKQLESKEDSKRKPESSSKLITVTKAENTLNLDGGRELKPNTSSVPKKPSKGKSLLKKPVVEKALIAEPFKKTTIKENMVFQSKTVLKDFRDLVVGRCSCKFDAEKIIRAALYNSEAKNFTPFQKLLAKEKQKALKVLNTINDTFCRPQKDAKLPQYDHKKKRSSKNYGQHQSYILRRYNKRRKIHKPKSKKYSNHHSRNYNPNVDSFVQLNSLLWEDTSCNTKQTKSEIQLHVLHTLANVKDNNSDLSVVDSSLSNSVRNKIDNKEHQLLPELPTIEEYGRSCPHFPKEPSKCNNSIIRNVCSDEELSRSTKSSENITLSQALLKIQNFIITSEMTLRTKKEIITETKKFQDDFVPSKTSITSNSVFQEENRREKELGDNMELNKNYDCIRGVKNTPKNCSTIAIQSEEKFPVNSLRNIEDYNDDFQVSFTSKEVRQFIQHSCNAMKNVALTCGISNTRNVQGNPSNTISLGNANNIDNNIVILEHHPNKMCCYYFDTCSSFLYEVAHHSRKWSKWVKQIFKGIHTFTSFVKEIKEDDDEKMKTLYQNEWHNFTVMVCKMLNSWQKYSQEIRKVTEYVLLKFKRKGVKCCPKCLEEGRINDVYLMQEVTKKLTDAITTAELWREWLDDVMSQAFLLIDSHPKLDNPNPSYKNMIHTFSQIALYIGEASKTIQKIETTSFKKENSFAFTE